MKSRRGLLIASFAMLTFCVMPAESPAAPATFSGTITYDGSAMGDTLYVAVIDTAGSEDATLVALQVIKAGTSPFARDYCLDFDNTPFSPELFVAAFLDVDGGGIDDISGADVFGWYDGASVPRAIPSGSSNSTLDFALPRGEIRGTVTLAPGQTEARIELSTDAACILDGFRPGHFAFVTGPYAIVGVYPGTYCVRADGFDMTGPRRVCYGDPTCAAPTSISLSVGEVRTGIDLDFTGVAIQTPTWGRLKSRYR